MAKKNDRKAAVAVRELKRPWLVPLLACIYFIVTCMMFHGGNKLITLLLILSSIVCVVVRNGVLSRRLTLPALLLGLYVLLDGVSTLYAPSGKFALYEFLKVASAACMALLLTGCEPERDAPYAGRCAAVVLEVSGALASLFSIDMVSTRWLYNGLCGLIQALGVPFGNEALQDQRLRTILENPNVFAGAAGIALLLSLGLAASALSKKERCLHLSCLLITCTAFILAVSRGAMGAIAVAFLAYLLLSRGPQRAAGDLQIIRVQLAQRLSAVAAAAETAKALRSVQPREIRLRIPAGKLARVLGDKAHLLFLARAPLALTPGQLTHRPLVSGAFAPQSRRLESAIVLMALRRGSAVPLLRRAVLRGRHDLPDLFRSFVFVHLGLLSAGVRPGPRIPLR